MDNSGHGPSWLSETFSTNGASTSVVETENALSTNQIDNTPFVQNGEDKVINHQKRVYKRSTADVFWVTIGIAIIIAWTYFIFRKKIKKLLEPLFKKEPSKVDISPTEELKSIISDGQARKPHMKALDVLQSIKTMTSKNPNFTTSIPDLPDDQLNFDTVEMYGVSGNEIMNLLSQPVKVIDKIAQKPNSDILMVETTIPDITARRYALKLFKWSTKQAANNKPIKEEFEMAKSVLRGQTVTEFNKDFQQTMPLALVSIEGLYEDPKANKDSETKSVSNLALLYELHELDLGELIKANDLNMDSKVYIAQSAAKALLKTLDLGIIHNDVKPSNFLLAQDCSVRMCDYGGSSLSGKRSAEAIFSATHGAPEVYAEFLSNPEQGILGNSQSDLFALGSTLYEIFTNAFPGEKREKISKKRESPQSYLEYI